MAAGRITGALLAGALLFALAPAAAGVTCPADRIDRRAAVAWVNDGDTVELADGTRVRLVGVNAPEFGRDGAPDQPFAADARAALVSWLEAAGERLHLRLDAERRDDYGRLLAHAFLPDGRSVSRLLLERGLAARVTVPPNTWHHACYARAERVARAAGRGVWTLPRFAGLPAPQLPPDAGGFYIIEGTIERVGESRYAWWLVLDSLTLRLHKRDQRHFEGLEPAALAGRSLRVRGWIYRAHGQARMNLRHPAAVEWLEPG
ncbi:MAG: thermonuclease family protein [Halofilum sp. (in: g-proteobacteria)]|nr:thermonuclease family protein [Halofilum sp. (in: g-proteobacteria)]